ncbi:MAG TPA: hypothetical protein DEF47_12430 [Herpetosiphon sp.]|nr:hypothetical protein [Herpetosiphon sp.]HBW50701.1 hypothetical protein [Herpetosiphon sp.]
MMQPLTNISKAVDRIIESLPQLQPVLESTTYRLGDDSIIIRNKYPEYRNQLKLHKDLLSNIILEELDNKEFNFIIDESDINFIEFDRISSKRSVSKNINHNFNIENNINLNFYTSQSIDVIDSGISQYLDDFKKRMVWPHYKIIRKKENSSKIVYEISFISIGELGFITDMTGKIYLRKIGGGGFNIKYINPFHIKDNIDKLVEFHLEEFDKIKKWHNFEIDILESSIDSSRNIIVISREIFEYIEYSLKEDEIIEDNDLYRINRNNEYYVNLDRIKELSKIQSKDFDITKLVKLCLELNISFSNECYFAAIFILRAIIDHIPPIFGHINFDNVVSNYKGNSGKKILNHLLVTLKNTAHINIHKPISRKEIIPNRQQVDFKSEIDFLLSEIIQELS